MSQTIAFVCVAVKHTQWIWAGRMKDSTRISVFLFYVLASHFTALQRNSMYILHIEMHVLNTCILLFFHIKVKSFNIFKFWKCSGHNMKNITCKTRNHHLVLWKSSSKSLKLSSYYLKLLPCFLKLPWNNVKISLVSFFYLLRWQQYASVSQTLLVILKAFSLHFALSCERDEKLPPVPPVDHNYHYYSTSGRSAVKRCPLWSITNDFNVNVEI